MKYAFVNAEMIVVQVITGALNSGQIAQFEHDYAILFDAEFSIPVFEGTNVWIGGRYNPETGEFSEPEPAPEPQPEPLPEPEPEPEI